MDHVQNVVFDPSLTKIAQVLRLLNDDYALVQIKAYGKAIMVIPTARKVCEDEKVRVGYHRTCPKFFGVTVGWDEISEGLPVWHYQGPYEDETNENFSNFRFHLFNRISN